MIPTELILKKRSGQALSRLELQFLVDGFLEGTIPDYQMSSFLMAVFFQNMNFEETTALTDIMLQTGASVDLSSIKAPKVDKHSTGGVGDKVSLMLAPMVAACGVAVPMISGRGLGHTGGTLDKLESIPGFRTNISLDEFKRTIQDIGVAMIGQTAAIAPADKRMYALRDVTGTVECIPLIASSIMSKKLAEGIDALVLDVKTGSGAFMKTEEDAALLAKTLIAVGERSGKKTLGLLTDMSQPLGFAVGNWLEVAECIECLRGSQAVPDLMTLTFALGGAMLSLAGKAQSIAEGSDECRKAIRSGSALRKFLEMVKKQGGELSVIEHPESYPKSRITTPVTSQSGGFVDAIDPYEIGYANIMLGGGRIKIEDSVDPKAGIVLKKKVGDPVKPGETLASLFTDKEAVVEPAVSRAQHAFRVAATRPPAPTLIRSIVDARGVHPWTDSASI